MKKIMIGLIALVFMGGVAIAATPAVVPRADGEGSLGSSSLAWGRVYADTNAMANSTEIKSTSASVVQVSGGTNLTLDVLGAEGSTAALSLSADEADDTADKWTLTAEVDDTLTVDNGVTEMSKWTTDGSFIASKGIGYAYASEQTNDAVTLTAVNCIWDVDTTNAAVNVILPEASTVLGQMFAVYHSVDGGNDVTFVTDGTDKFDRAGNDIITFADANDSAIVVAVGANRYAIIANVGGTLSD